MTTSNQWRLYIRQIGTHAFVRPCRCTCFTISPPTKRILNHICCGMHGCPSRRWQTSGWMTYWRTSWMTQRWMTERTQCTRACCHSVLPLGDKKEKRLWHMVHLSESSRPEIIRPATHPSSPATSAKSATAQTTQLFWSNTGRTCRNILPMLINSTCHASWV